MVSFKDITDDSAKPLKVNIQEEVDRLRMEVEMAQKGYFLSDEEPNPEALLKGFETPDDFVVKEKTLNYGNGELYKGECLGNMRHGQGKHTCADGTVYEGSWKYDKRDGKGKIQFKDGLMYDGEWKDDLAHGTGVAQYQNGTVYIGDFQSDHRWGWGTQYFAGNERYEGEWLDDKITGKGRFTYQDESYYEGEWEDGMRIKGKFVSADGSFEYSGSWKGNLRHGYGVMYQRGIQKYMGEWQDDLQSGEGKCLYADGSAYDGEWKAAKRHGKGKLVSPAYKYDGEWADDKQQGQGACQLDNGDKYVGEFQGGVRHGMGRCAFADGTKYEGEWAADKRHGKGTCLYSNGDRYQGEWQSDRRHGYGVCKFADGTKFRGEWEDDGWVQSAADPQRCRVAGPGVTRAAAGQQAEFVIQARDEAGNRRLSGGDEFQVLLKGPSASLAAAVADKGDGTYSVTYTATVADVYQLHITIGADEHVADSPYPLRVLPGKPCARKCEVAGEGRSKAVVGQQAAFQIIIHDEFGNRWFGDNLAQLLPLEVTLEGPGGQEVPVSSEPQRDGHYACAYTPPAPGFYRLHVAHGKAPLPRTPFSVQVTDAEAGEGPEGAAAPGADAQAPAPAPAAAVRDEMKLWEEIALRAYAADGVLEGWDDERGKKHKTAEEKYLEEHPNVAVVENLEDMWVLSKFQREKQAKEEAEKHKKLQEMRDKLEQSFGPAQRHDPEKLATEVKQIIQEDLLAHNIIQPALAPSRAAPAVAGAGSSATALQGGADAPEVGAAGPQVPADGAAAAAVAAARLPRMLPRNQLKAAAAALEQLD